jgi:alkane 1-monooxygenase
MIFVSGIISEIYFNNFFVVVWLPFVALPIIDYLMPVDHSNVTEERVRAMEKDKRFLIPLYTIWVMDFAILYWLMYRVSIGEICLTAGQFLSYAFCAAQPGAVNAVVGHELIHRRWIFHKIMGTLSYFKMFYSHYFIQHIRGHHKIVGTPADASTARFGESVFEFYLRAIPRGLEEVWEYEQNRLK